MDHRDKATRLLQANAAQRLSPTNAKRLCGAGKHSAERHRNAHRTKNETESNTMSHPQGKSTASTLKYAFIVFMGGASYGVMAPVIKLAYGAGFAWQQVVAGQAVFGALIFGLVLLAQMARGKRPERMSGKSALRLMGLGATTCCTSVLYAIALSMLPVAVALTLLFQFTWIGIVIQVIVTRTPPHPAEVVSALMVIGGTVLASGLLASELAGSYNPFGLACGLLSSVSCALFMFFSSRIEVGMAPIQRGFFVCLGAMALSLIVCPSLIPSGTVLSIAPFGLLQGLFALFFPVILFGIGTPHLPTGISTILASVELPCSIALTFLILGEGIDGLQAVGVACILLGVVVSQLPALLGKHGQTTQES